MLEIGKNIPKPEGKDLSGLDELKILLENGRLGLVTSSDDSWFLIKDSETQWVGMPGPEFGNFLYRGEPKKFPESKASILRPSEEIKNNLHLVNIEYLVRVAKLREFFMIMRRYPGTKELSKWKVADKLPSIDYESQAQHYGLRSMLVDFSSSIDVAEFFARCRKVETSDTLWEMIPKNEFDGQLFTLDLAQMLAAPSSRKELVFMGVSPFMRPYRQKAWGIYTKHQCIQKHPLTRHTKLEFSESRSLELLAKFDNGRILFPDDLMGRIALRIEKSESIAYQALLAAKNYLHSPQNMGRLRKGIDQLSKALNPLSYTIEDRALFLSDDEAKQFGQEWLSFKNEYSFSANLRWGSAHSKS